MMNAVNPAQFFANLDSGDYAPLDDEAYELEALIAHYKYLLSAIPDPQEREFVKYAVTGMTYYKAARAAGYPASQAHKKVFKKVAQRPEIQRAIMAARVATAFANTPTRTSLLRQRYAIATSNVLDFFEFNEDHTAKFIGHLADREAWGTVKKIKVRRYTEGKGEDAKPLESIELEFYDKQKELQALGADLGFWQAPEPHNMQNNGVGRTVSNDKAFRIVPVPSGKFIDAPVAPE
jgi:hypothetical protein